MAFAGRRGIGSGAGAAREVLAVGELATQVEGRHSKLQTPAWGLLVGGTAGWRWKLSASAALLARGGHAGHTICCVHSDDPPSLEEGGTP